MKTYAAFLRGIMPSNPNMRNEKLKTVFESLGFKNVQTVISSGNLIFSANSKNISALETKIEKELLKQLGIKCPAFIRSKEDLKKMINKKPFKDNVHSPKTYLLVSFLRKPPFEIYTTVNLNDKKTPDFMREIDKKYNKEVTSRTWKTVERIYSKITTLLE